MPPRRISKRHYKTRSSYVVVSVNPDGTVDAVFNGAADAAKLYGVKLDCARYNLSTLGVKSVVLVQEG